MKGDLKSLPAPEPGDPGLAARELRKVLATRVRRLVAADALSKEAVDELAKIAASLSKLESHGYDLRTACMDVCRRLAVFAAGRDDAAEKRAWLADLLAEFFERMDGAAR